MSSEWINDKYGVLVLGSEVFSVRPKLWKHDTIFLEKDTNLAGPCALLIRSEYPSKNIYEFVSVNGEIKNDKITINSLEGWIPENESFMSWMQKSMPGGEEYITELNRDLLAQLYQNSFSSWIVSASGSSVVSKRYEIDPDNSRFSVLLNTDDNILPHIRTTGMVTLLVDGVDTNNLRVDCLVDDIMNLEGHIRVFLIPVLLKHSNGTVLETLSLRNKTIAKEELKLSFVGIYRIWGKVIRLPVIMTSILPILLGAKLWHSTSGTLNWNILLLTIISMILAQVGIQLLQEYIKYIRFPTDLRLTRSPLSSTRFLHRNLTTPGWVFRTSIVFLLLSFIIALYLDTRIEGHIILLLGTSGAFLAFSYAAPPLKLSDKGVGELIAILIFGPIPTLASYLIQGQVLPTMDIIYLGILPGLFSAWLVFLNNTDDIHIDRMEGRITLASKLGSHRAIILGKIWPLIIVVVTIALLQLSYSLIFLYLLLLSFPIDITLQLLDVDQYMRIYTQQWFFLLVLLF